MRIRYCSTSCRDVTRPSRIARCMSGIDASTTLNRAAGLDWDEIVAVAATNTATMVPARSDFMAEMIAASSASRNLLGAALQPRYAFPRSDAERRVSTRATCCDSRGLRLEACGLSRPAHPITDIPTSRDGAEFDAAARCVRSTQAMPRPENAAALHSPSRHRVRAAI